MDYVIHIHDAAGVANLEGNGLGWYAGSLRTEGTHGVPVCGEAERYHDANAAIREAQKISICCPSAEIVAVMQKGSMRKFVDAAQDRDWDGVRELCEWAYFRKGA